jgi:hypothetical protein
MNRIMLAKISQKDKYLTHVWNLKKLILWNLRVDWSLPKAREGRGEGKKGKG